MVFQINNGNEFSNFVTIILILIILSIIIFGIYSGKKYVKNNLNLYYREELFNALCSNIDDVFAIYHLVKNRFEYISPNIERILGFSSKSFLSNPNIVLDYLCEKSIDEIKSIFSTNILKSGYEVQYEYHNPVTKQTLWLILRIYPVFSHQAAIRYICSVSDLTKEMRTQQVLKDALLNAQRANEAKKDFLSHMSHELKTPISAVLGMVQIASNSPDNKEKVENCLEKIKVWSNNLLDIINNILDMARIDSDKLLITNKPFCMSELLCCFSSIVLTQAELNHQKFDLICANIKDDALMGDTLRLTQILGNCVTNSLKFTPPGGKIKLEVYEIEKHANKALFRFIITDNGKGMSEEYIDRIFIPFEQEDSSVAIKYGGSGLGMSITKNLVGLMGGNIRVASKVNVGTIITIDIVLEVHNEQPTKEVLKTHVWDLSDFDFSNQHILVVEDNDINLEIACEILKNTKVSYDTARNGYEAIKLFTDSKPGLYNLILMDVHMPGLSGYETARAIRSSKHTDANNVAIIAISADSSAEEILLLDCGINYHLSRPIDISHFYPLLHKVFNESSQ